MRSVKPQISFRYFLKVKSVILFGLFLLFLSPQQAKSQSTSGINRQDVIRELQKREISEKEFLETLQENSLNIDSIQFYPPDKIGRIQAIILDLERAQTLSESDTIPEVIDPMEIETLEENDLDSISVDSIGEEVFERYGRKIYGDGTFRISSDPYKIKAPSSYILGTGDELAISVWGSSKVDDLYEIGNEGFIEILNEQVRILLKGLTIIEAKQKIKDVYRQYYRFNDGQFDVSLSYSRTVQVNVYGEVETPGPISVPAVNSVFSIIAAAGGPSKIGTVRNIEIIRSDGSRYKVDLFDYMKNPFSDKQVYLQDNDVIFISPLSVLVEAKGGVNRPFKYELKEGERLRDLVEYAGGFDPNAQTEVLRIIRNDKNNQKVIDVKWPQESNFVLINGDILDIPIIERSLESFVSILGAVEQEGYYELYKQMRITDLLKISGIKENARKDAAFIKRVGPDSTISYISIDINSILEDPNGAGNIYLQNKDELTIWYLERFADRSDFSITGAVREEGNFELSARSNLKVSDAIILGGGLRRDASNKLIIHRKDPLNPKIISYFTISDISEVLRNPTTESNIYIEPFDSLYIYPESEFIEDSYVTVQGAVNKPGRFQYGQQMSLRDLLTLSGGFKRNAATNQVEISRILIENNQPTTVNVANLTLDEGFKVQNSDSEYMLEPFDVITVRYVPEFELQKTVFISGEVKFPGPYTILDDNERILNIIKRAGDVTEESFLPGATLDRGEDNLGAVVIKLDEIYSNKQSDFNFIVKDKDRIFIPKKKEFVTIEGATRAKTMLLDEAVNFNNRIHVPFEGGKRAMFYINNYAGGLAENADPNSIFVEHPNGEIKKSVTFLFITRTPKVRKGSVIKVRKKQSEEDKEEQASTDWSKILQDTVSQAVTIVTLLLAIQGLN